MTVEEVILVDECNRMVGRADKLAAHRDGLLHRAFSIFLIDDGGRIICQRRHPSKYHSGGLWANTCCGHPRPLERTLASAHRRLFEELGVTASLHLAFQSRYRCETTDGLTENELIYVYFGRLVEVPRAHPDEVDALMALSLEDLHRQVAHHGERYAVWLRYYLRYHAEDLQRAVAASTRRNSAMKRKCHRVRLSER